MMTLHGKLMDDNRRLFLRHKANAFISYSFSFYLHKHIESFYHRTILTF